MQRIKSGDNVYVLSGKDRGKTGKVLQVFTEENKASVEGINLMVRHLRAQKRGEKGQKVQFPAPILLDKLLVVCPKCSKATKVGAKITEDKKRLRVCKKCKEVI